MISLMITDSEVGGLFVTVTVRPAVRELPSVLMAVMRDEPLPMAVTSPLSSTVATCGRDERHCSFLMVAFSGATVAVICNVSPATISALLGSRVILSTGTTSP